jgi:hypothetical protein
MASKLLKSILAAAKEDFSGTLLDFESEENAVLAIQNLDRLSDIIDLEKIPITKKLLLQNPESIDLHIILARFFSSAGHHTESAEEYKKAVELMWGFDLIYGELLVNSSLMAAREGEFDYIKDQASKLLNSNAGEGVIQRYYQLVLLNKTISSYLIETCEAYKSFLYG